jgi:tetratricopeptide (TPR) repeat protein
MNARAFPALLCLTLLIPVTDAALAQALRITPTLTPQPLLLAAEPALSQHVHDPLSVDQLLQLRQARSYRDAHLFDRAMQTLTEVRATAPRHPLILTELARLLLARDENAAVERLGRSERWTQKDSLLLGRELTVAYERLGRARRAAKVVIEVWVAAPDQHRWAHQTLLRLHPLDASGITRVLRRAFEPRPERVDMARTLAQLEWRAHDTDAMLSALRSADREGMRPPLRWQFAEELLRHGAEHDSTGAVESLLDLSADRMVDEAYRAPAARRAWAVLTARGEGHEGAPRLARALADLPSERWELGFLVEIARSLREGGHTKEARKLIDPFADRATLLPALAVEHALNDLRDGPPQAVLAELKRVAETSHEGLYYFGEALFFAGLMDSALAQYKRVAQDPRGKYAGAALERIYLIEDAQPVAALLTLGRVAYEEWRGDIRAAVQMTDSLYLDLPRGELWAQAAILLAGQLEKLGNPESALEPLLAVADSLPGARLASFARQRAGDIYLFHFQDRLKAMEQYEECLARYPHAWNSADVRRKLQRVRRDQRMGT